MHGTGNDFILINGLIYSIDNYQQASKILCQRHFNIGGDGLIIVLPPENKDNDFKMRIFNSDGSEAEMCGNGIRCFTQYVYKNNLTQKHKLKIETKAGIIKPEITETSGLTAKIKVNMGKPEFQPEKVPVKFSKKNSEFVEDLSIQIKNKTFNLNCVSMGNPHTVIFTNDLNQIELSTWGPKIETMDIFPNKTNVEFIEIINENKIKMKVWERGSGITLSCGTGACAAAVMGIRKKMLSAPIQVNLPGGELIIDWQNKNSSPVWMTGPSKIVFNGQYLNRGDINGNC